MTDGADATSVSTSKNPPMKIIQQHMVVLGDTHARAGRTTLATTLLRELKDSYRKHYKGGKKSIWIPLAIEEFRRRLPTLFAPGVCSDEEMGMVVVKCTPKAMEARTERILVPNVYGYEGDDEPTFGTAKWRESLEFFLESRDAPNLASELEKHRKAFDKLRKSTTKRPPTHMMNGFAKTLVFFQEKLEEASRGDALADQLLDSLKPINSLNKQWKTLVSNSKPVTDATVEQVPWDGVSLQVVPRVSHPKPKRVTGVPTLRKFQRPPRETISSAQAGGMKRTRPGKYSPVVSSIGVVYHDVPSYPVRSSPVFSGAEMVPAPHNFQPPPLPPPTEVQETTITNTSWHSTEPNETNFDSLIQGDLFDLESDFLEAADDIDMSGIMPDDWNDEPQQQTNPPSSWSGWLFGESNTGETISLPDDSESRASLSVSMDMSTASSQRQQPKAFLAPSWMLLKIAAVASLFGLHSFRSQITLPKSWQEHWRPADMPDPVTDPGSPCPSDKVCLRIMEAIYPFLPDETLPLIGVPGTCQNWAREWLGTNRDITEFSDARIRQRYALAVFYCETDGASWDEKQLWLSDLHECDWQPEMRIDPCNRYEELQVLRNNGQQMRGRLPPELSMITSLWELSLSDNMLYGTIPTSLARLTSLDTLVLGTNMFQGQVPDFVWEYRDLITLDLAYNNFTGTLPDELHISSPSLKNLYLSYNSFSGSIPSDFGMMEWQHLDLAGNQLEGTIPNDINAGKMEVLDLHENHLTGTFPADLFATVWSGRRSKLRIVSLYRNNLTGSVEELCSLFSDPSVGSLETFVVDLDKVNCTCCSDAL